MEEEALKKIFIMSYEGAIPAGFPSPAQDYLEKRIDLNEVFITNELSSFLFESEGNSMINAFIPPRAKLLVDRSITPLNGDIVLAILDGEFTIKFLKKNEFKCWLCAANPKFPDIQITEEMNMKVWGVVTGIFIKPRDVKSCML
ncbi:MAG: translesion error-prone DNA polymerase V autoproteolytic subunit [Ginsengibacter sp.]